jgi:UDP-N-acetyl-D-glucosamine dehydrogenase
VKIGIIGLGYVGLPLALQFARSGHDVVGLDVDAVKVDAIENGVSYIRHISSESITEQTGAGKLFATTNFKAIASCGAVIICVPTPLNKNREPDISYILKTGEAIGRYLRPDTLVVLESTTYPGTTENDLRPLLEERSGMIAGVDFALAYSPEREDPGNPHSVTGKIPKLVGGLTPECLAKAVELYSSAIETVVPVVNCRVAEAAKLLENIYRAVNIALVNELKVVYEAMDIDIWDVIEAAKTKPYGFTPFYPGPGLGGHCIPIDPFYLTWKAREFGINTKFIELAGEINTSMPNRVVCRLTEILSSTADLALKGAHILLVGLAYKPDVEDERESPTWKIWEILEKRGAIVSYHDSFIPEIHHFYEHPKWNGTKSVEFTEENIRAFDAVVICTAHEDLDRESLAKWARCIIDTRNALRGNGHVFKA